MKKTKIKFIKSFFKDFLNSLFPKKEYIFIGFSSSHRINEYNILKECGKYEN